MKQLSLMLCTLFILSGCGTKYADNYKENTSKEKTGIIPARWAKMTAQASLRTQANEWIVKAATKGQTWDKFYMGWFDHQDVIELIAVLIQQGYAVRVTQNENKEIVWIYVAWDHQDEFNRMSQEDFDK